MALPRSARRQRGHIRPRGSGFQVLVYSGTDPLTGKTVYLTETTRTHDEAEKARTRLLAQVDRQRSTPTRATFGYTLDTWLDVHEADEHTIANYRGYVERTIKPALGDEPVSKVSAQLLEKSYAELRRCGARCKGQPLTDHRATRPHECRTVRHRRRPGRPSAAERLAHDCATAGCTVIECKPHTCKPLSAGTILVIHSIISGALSMAARWDGSPTTPPRIAKKPCASTPPGSASPTAAPPTS